MKLTTKQLKEIILETFRKAQKASGAKYTEPSLAYAEDLSGMLGARLDRKPIRGNQYRMYLTHYEGVEIEIGLPGTMSWPYGASIMITQFPMRPFPVSLEFPVTGNPEIDVEFINRLTSMSLSEISDLSDAALGYSIPSKSAFGPMTRVPPTMKRGSWYDMIMPGYPGAYLQ
jgi:hypothetical protein